MIASQYLATTMLNAGTALYNGGTLLVYQGEYPTVPEGAPSGGSTLLATFTFANPAFPSGPTYMLNFGMLVQASFTSNSVTPAAAGTACYAIAKNTSGAVLEQRTVGMSWAPSLSVIPYQFIFANNNIYICAVGGTTASSGLGPSGTGNTIADGSVSWKWFAAGAPDIQITNAVLSTGSPLSLPQFWTALPCL